MDALLMPCILTLLDKPGATLRDLLHFMAPELPRQPYNGRNADLERTAV